MPVVTQERRVLARRLVADRRFAIPRRTRRDRRVQNRRTVSRNWSFHSRNGAGKRPT